MSVSAGTAFVDIAPKFDKFGAGLAGGLGAAFGKLGNLPGLNKLESKLTALGTGIGGKLTKVVTLPFLAIGAAAVASALDVEHAEFTIRRRTGETGEALKGLEEDFKDVAKQTGASFGDIADVLSTVHQRLGLVGAPLQALTLTILRLRKVTGDAAPSVDDVTKLFAQWNVATKLQIPTLDELYRVTQKSGIGMSDLVGVLVRFAPQLKTVGFNLENSAALLGSLSKAGIDASQVMSGLRAFFGKIAKEGKDPAKAFADVIAKIQQLGKEGKSTAALQLGVKLFGSRGVGMVRAALDGKLAYQGFLDTVKNGKDTIAAANKQTLSFGDQFKIFKNQAVLALAPLGEKLFPLLQKAMQTLLPPIIHLLEFLTKLPNKVLLIVAALAALGPVISIFLRLRGAYKAFTLAMEEGKFAFLSNPIFLLGATLALIVVLLVKFHKEFIAGLKRIGADIAAVWNAIWSKIGPVLIAYFNIIKTIITTYIRIWIDIFKVAWAVISGVVRAAFVVIRAIIAAAWVFLGPFVKFGLGVIAAIFESVFNVIKNIVKLAWAVISTIFKINVAVIKGIISAGVWVWAHVIQPPLAFIGKIVVGAWNWIKKNVFPIISWIASHIGGAFRTVASVLSTIWDGISSTASIAWNGIWTIIKTIINFIIEGINGFIHGINAMIHGLNAVATPLHLIGVKSLPTIDTIPKLDLGGEVLKTGLAIVHRGETFSGVGGNAMGGVTVNVYGTVTTERQLIHTIETALLKKKRSNVALGLS